MSVSTLILTLLALAAIGFFYGRRRVLAAAGGNAAQLHSLPGHYGWYVAIWALLPGFLVAVLWLVLGDWLAGTLTIAHMSDAVAGMSDAQVSLFLNEARSVAEGGLTAGEPEPAVKEAAAYYAAVAANGRLFTTILALCGAGIGIAVTVKTLSPTLAARRHVERAVNGLLIACSTAAILITIGIVLSLLFETIRFFRMVPVDEFLLGLQWSPQTALRADQVGSSGTFGMVPLFVGTLLVTVIAMLVAVPVGLMSAIYMTYYASKTFRRAAKPVLEVLAGVPTVVYGFFAALVVAPFLRDLGMSLGLDVAAESALAAGLVMGLMIIPFVSSLSDDAITAVPETLRDGSYAMGATRSETITSVIIPAALPGIVGAVLLAVSRAVGETMIVVMAVGLAANLTANPLEAVTTITVQIVTLLTGDQEFDSARTLSAFALGLLLFVVTLALNVAAMMIVRRFREKYD